MPRAILGMFRLLRVVRGAARTRPASRGSWTTRDPGVIRGGIRRG